MPMKRSGRSVAAARRVIEIDDVLLPTMASGLRAGHSAVKILRLISSCSVADSITRSQSLSSSSVVAGEMRLIAACRCSSLMRCRLTCRAKFPPMVARPSVIRSAATSFSKTLKPDSAQTWAMPLPICPAPITPILRNGGAVSFPSPARAGCARGLVRSLGRSLTSTISVHLNAILRRSQSVRQIPSALNLVELCRKLRQGLVKIGDQTVVSHLEDRRLFILVDGYDHFRVLHAGEMLNGAGNADRDIEVGRHDLTGLPNLPIVWSVAGIDGGARGADCSAELVRHRFDIFGEVFAVLHRAAAGNDDFG